MCTPIHQYFLSIKLLKMKYHLTGRNKRIVTMLSNYNNTEMQFTLRTLHGGHVISVDRSELILNCTINLDGVDHADYYAPTYCFMRKSLKWWRNLFFGGTKNMRDQFLHNLSNLRRMKKTNTNDTL